jgi:hypothetical protein
MRSILRYALLLAIAFTVANAVHASTTPVKPGISKEPTAQTVTVGSSVTFSVTANGTATLKYQWKLGSGNITGATKANYTISKVSSANAGNYSVVVSNAAGSIRSTGAVLTVKSGYAGKYNLAIIGYNASLVDAPGGTFISDSDASGGAHYGTASVTTVASVSNLAGSLTKYLGTLPSAPISISGMVSTNGTVTLTDSGSNLTTNMVQYNGMTIGIFGAGTTPGGTGANDTLILGLNATTTAPASIKSCAGTYTMIVISYNATAVSKGNAAENDGDAEIARVTVASNGSVSISDTEYATGGGDTLGGTPKILTGAVSSSGVLTVTGRSGTSIKFVALNGQVIGIVGTFKPASGHSNSGFLLGIRGSFKPL